MTTLQMWLLKIIAALAILAGACGATWFSADAHYSRQLEALKASYEQAQKDATAEAAATLTRYAQAAQEVNDEAKSQLAGANAAAADLGVRLNDGYAAIQACGAASTIGADVAPGSGAATDSRPAAADAGRAEPQVPAVAGIDPQLLRDTLTTAIDAIDAELWWRQYARETGQVLQ